MLAVAVVDLVILAQVLEALVAVALAVITLIAAYQEPLAQAVAVAALKLAALLVEVVLAS
jgi:hypothetical protein